MVVGVVGRDNILPFSSKYIVKFSLFSKLLSVTVTSIFVC